MTDAIPDDELLRRVQSGDDLAVSELVRRLEPYIRRVARRKVPRALRTTHDSMDFVQQVWSSFAASDEAFGRFTDVVDLRRYLGGVAAKQVAEAVRSAAAVKRGGNGVRSVTHEALRDVAATVESPSQRLRSAEVLGRLTAGMPAGHKAAIAHLETGATQREAAELAGVSYGSLRRMIDRARRRRDGLTGPGDE